MSDERGMARPRATLADDARLECLARQRVAGAGLAPHRTRTIAAISSTLRAHRLALCVDQIDERLLTFKGELNRRPDRTLLLGETRALLTTLVAPERPADLTELAPQPSRQCKERQT